LLQHGHRHRHGHGNFGEFIASLWPIRLLRRLGYRLQVLNRSGQRLLERLRSGKKLLHGSGQRLLVCLRRWRKLLQSARYGALKRLHCRRELSYHSRERPLRCLSNRRESLKRACRPSDDTGQGSGSSRNDFRSYGRQQLGRERRQKRQANGIAKSIVDDLAHRLRILTVLRTIHLSVRDFVEVSC
jgi:hypothetical protein